MNPSCYILLVLVTRLLLMISRLGVWIIERSFFFYNCMKKVHTARAFVSVVFFHLLVMTMSLCRELTSIFQREVRCFMISCKDSTNIDTVIQWLIEHPKFKRWKSGTTTVSVVLFQEGLGLCNPYNKDIRSFTVHFTV